MVQAHYEPQDACEAGVAEDPPQLVDAHCHLDFEIFDSDRDAVMQRAEDVGVRRFVIAGYTPTSFRRARALRTSRVRVCAGLHPWALAELDDAAVEAALAELDALAPTADAIGELGLDAPLARRGSVSLERQRRVAIAALELARRHRLPVVLHVVGAHAEMLELCGDAGEEVGGMVHGFSGSAELADRWVRAGFHVSFGSAATHARNTRVRAAAKAVPLDRLLLESDAPDQPPDGVRGRNEPASVKRVLDCLAELRGRPAEEIARATSENAARLFFGV